MIKVEIAFPIWGGERKQRAVGVARYKIIDDLEIHIMYSNKHGVRIYPEPFYISREEALDCPIQNWKGLEIHIIPLSKLRQTYGNKQREVFQTTIIPSPPVSGPRAQRLPGI